MKNLNEQEQDRTRFGDLEQEDPDLQTVESFVEACEADSTTTFNWQHLAVLAWNLSRDRSKIRADLEAYGLRFVERPAVRRVRTFKDNPNDRWAGNPCAGGSGWEQITGFAGRAG